MQDDHSRRVPAHSSATPAALNQHIPHTSTAARRLLASLMLLAGLATPWGSLTGATGVGAALALAPRPAQAAAATADGSAAQLPTARVIVRFKSGAGLLAGHARALAAHPGSIGALSHAGTLGTRHGLALRDGRTVAPYTQVMTANGVSSAELAARLAADADVESAVPDLRRHAMAAPNDPLYHDNQTGTVTPVSGQWYLRAPTATVASSIDVEGAWAVSNGSASVVVAALDTGVRPEHPDLAGKLLPGYDFISNIPTANDNTVRDADPTDPGDWMTQAEVDSGIYGADCVADNSSWHGTQTTGLIGAATNNGIGMAGVGRNVMVMPVRVLGKCGGFDSDIIAAMQWAAGIHFAGIPDNPTPAKVVNLSLGSAGSCSTSSVANPTGFGTATNYTNAIAALVARNVAVVVSAGNDGKAVNLPANCAGAIAVSGLRHAGDKNGFSSLGPEVTVSAPGGNCPSGFASCQYPMLSTINNGATVPDLGATGSRYSNSGDAELGTSFSAPLVSGTAALMFSANPSLTVKQIHDLLQSSARQFPTTGGGDAGSNPPLCSAPGVTEQVQCYCTKTTCGAGMLDAGAALRAVAALGTVANFSATPSYPTPSQVVTLDASGSSIQAGQGPLTYLWEITSNTNGASFTSATNASAATLKTGSSTGTVTVRLTVTDNTGSHVISQNIDVGAVTNTVVTATPATSSGGGSFATPPSLAWLAGLALAVVALAHIRRRTRR